MFNFLNEDICFVTITAEAGLSVVIPCSFTPGFRFYPQNLVWYKCEPAKQRCSDSDIIFATNENRRRIQGRVSLLEPDVRQKTCSFIINDLKESDSGSYQFRVNGKKSYNIYTNQKPILMIPLLTEGQQTTLTCTAPGLCSGSKPEITWMWMGAGGNSSQITENISDVRIENTDVLAQRYSSTLTFNPSAEHHGTTVTCKVRFTGNVATEETVTLNVTREWYKHYIIKTLAGRLSLTSEVREGDMLSLTCGIESFPPSVIKWTRFSELITENGTETHKQNNTDTPVQEGNGKVTLSISNVTAKDSGLYICTVQYLNNIWNKTVDVKVKYVREPALTGNTTVEKGDTLNLTCRAESFPPALITWTKLRSSTSLANGTPLIISEPMFMFYSIKLLTCVCISEGSPLPSITWPLLKNHNEHSVITSVSNYTINSTMSLRVKGPSNISVECISSNLNGEAKEILTTSPKKTGIFTIYHTAATDHSFMVFLIPLLLDLYLENHFAPELDTGLKDVEYASIDFSLLKRQKPSQAAVKQETTETEYAEIKKEQQEEKGDKLREEGKMMEGEEEEAMIEQAKDTKRCDPEEEEGEDTAVYSNVKDIMSQV
uniref:Ig-like domain-containing protein n=1 Tax=Echeneis naucrates TaxID=173247 RepID=A0A665UVX4_ECHNA